MVNLARRLDRLERLAHELLNARSGPIYLREGSELPAGVDPDRVIYIQRVLIDPPEQPQEHLPEIVEPPAFLESAALTSGSVYSRLCRLVVVQYLPYQVAAIAKRAASKLWRDLDDAAKAIAA